MFFILVILIKLYDHLLYLNQKSLCPVKCGGLSIDQSLFIDTQLGFGDTDLSICIELKIWKEIRQIVIMTDCVEQTFWQMNVYCSMLCKR